MKLKRVYDTLSFERYFDLKTIDLMLCYNNTRNLRKMLKKLISLGLVLEKQFLNDTHPFGVRFFKKATSDEYDAHFLISYDEYGSELLKYRIKRFYKIFGIEKNIFYMGEEAVDLFYEHDQLITFIFEKFGEIYV
ncbi:MAG: hypothetical protein INQ03_13730 [Candidatus Heimdallarchaeota archaeon]|nr:hypothetical protein [Candidatus Heimdallarchaeota archaeon]